jgi:hypothetical protein
MTQINQAQIKWMFGSLYFRSNPFSSWVHYKQCPYYLPDYQVPNGSKGFRTMQNCLARGVVYCQDTPNYPESDPPAKVNFEHGLPQ